MSDPEIVIIGAGAAGIGAGLALADKGVDSLILEAADRVGGRAYTDTASLPVPWDHGCHWLHSADRNPLVAWADRLGADYRREVREGHFAIWSAGRFVGPEELKEARACLLAGYDALDDAGRDGRDISIAEALPDAGRWSAGVRCILQMMAGEDPELVSAPGYADYDDTDVNWPVYSGYGALIARMAEGLPIRLGVRATRVEQGPDRQGTGGVRIETDRGTIRARAAIVTVSTNVLRTGGIAFTPGPAADLLGWIEDVPCGAYEKVAFALSELPPEAKGKLFCMVDPGGGAPASDFQVMATDPPLMIAHLAGSLAREASRDGEAAMIAFATERLELAFGTGIRKRILGTGASGWLANPLILGAYTEARPGTARQRHDLIAADSGTVAFAGEAFSQPSQGTAHGAFQSGQDIARRVMRHLR